MIFVDFFHTAKVEILLHLPKHLFNFFSKSGKSNIYLTLFFLEVNVFAHVVAHPLLRFGHALYPHLALVGVAGARGVLVATKVPGVALELLALLFGLALSPANAVAEYKCNNQEEHNNQAYTCEK